MPNRELSHPVQSLPWATNASLTSGTTGLPARLLERGGEAEAGQRRRHHAGAVGLRTAAAGSVTGIQETSIRALAKLEQVLPSRLRNRVNALQAATVEIPAPGPAVNPEVSTAIAGACRDCQRLRFDYRDHDGSATWRYRARVRVHAPAAMVAGRLPPAVVVEAVDEHTCVIDVGSDTPQMLALYLGMLEVDFDVEDPELVEQLRTLADRYRRVITTTGPFSSG
jgi:hypothetical protein